MPDQSEKALLSELEDIVDAAAHQAEAEMESQRRDVRAIATRFSMPPDLAWRAYQRYLRLLEKQPPSGGFTHPVNDDIRRVLLGVAVGIEMAVSRQNPSH